MDQHDDDPEREDGYPGAFRDLLERPTPELDAHRLWLRIEPHLKPRSRAWRALPFAGRAPLRFAWGTAALVLVTLAVWAALSWQASVPGRQIVLLTPDRADSGAPGAGIPVGDERTGAHAGVQASAQLRLEVRLVRGYDGPPPGDVSAAEALGVGGADALLDARTSIERLLPFESFGLVGTGGAALDENAPLEIALSRDYRLVVRSVGAAPTPEEAVRLEGVELEGSGAEARPIDLSLEPGRLYILGVLAPGEEHPELVLLIRAQPARPESR